MRGSRLCDALPCFACRLLAAAQLYRKLRNFASAKLSSPLLSAEEAVIGCDARVRNVASYLCSFLATNARAGDTDQRYKSSVLKRHILKCGGKSFPVSPFVCCFVVKELLLGLLHSSGSSPIECFVESH